MGKTKYMITENSCNNSDVVYKKEQNRCVKHNKPVIYIMQYDFELKLW